MKKKNKEKYKLFVELLIKQIKKARIPKFLSKFSKRLYSIWQHLILSTFKQMLNLSYREFVAWLENSKLLEILELKQIPHYTTLHKFSQRARPVWLDAIVDQAINLVRKHKLILAIDSTGFSLKYGSSYYCDRTIVVKRKRRWVKLSIATDTNTQLILASKIQMTPRNDHRDFIPLMSKMEGKDIRYVCADKGYDSEKNHKFVIKVLKSRSLIAVKRKFSSHNRKTIRKYVAKNFNEVLYHERSKAETVFSVIKRIFGSVLRARKFYMRVKEVLFKIIAYNTRRLFKIIFLFTEDFYRANISKTLNTNPYYYVVL